MFRVLDKKQLNDSTYSMTIYAPLVSQNIHPGQFVMVMADENSERIPLTIADFNKEEGSVTIIFQAIGGSTIKLASKNTGEEIAHFAGPLGIPTELEGIKNACVIGGGVGCAIALPQAKWLKNHGAAVDVIAGFRNKDIIILEDEMKNAATALTICTDDGSYGVKGFVTNVLKENIESGKNYDCVIAIGPVPMMKAVSDITKEYGIKTIVSLNPIMIDGTGMCGGCRVNVDGKVKFACVDGPDFDGHKVDFKELMIRNNMYRNQEAEHKNHICRLYGGKGNV
ncbi:MAG: sulfide/dihydroorotate dehydrogenase-like FAD/NAD-binding protein [Oscillospiraceae bacterium]|nr:sulfide/dihydroorotate dehydrogenase-like FAD/NAD-binding protein [Oscillospiraceae bacterium]